MESFEDIQRQEEAHLLGEIGALARRLVELGWSQDQVLAYVKELLTESMDPASDERNSDGKER
jgi:hypothetical protein